MADIHLLQAVREGKRLILVCPDCGRVIELDEETHERRVVDVGFLMKIDAATAVRRALEGKPLFTVRHVWSEPGLCAGAVSGTEEPEQADSPTGGPSCACGLVH